MMDTQVFQLGLSVHALSLYILVHELVDSGTRPTMEAIRAMFNASPEETDAAISELVLYKVLYKAGSEESPSWHPNPASLWENPASKA
jgi:hypothetical protein